MLTQSISVSAASMGLPVAVPALLLPVPFVSEVSRPMLDFWLLGSLFVDVAAAAARPPPLLLLFTAVVPDLNPVDGGPANTANGYVGLVTEVGAKFEKSYMASGSIEGGGRGGGGGGVR